MKAEACGEWSVPWLSQETKDSLAKYSAPWVRRYLRLVPSIRLREVAWKRVIAPRIWWRKFDFAARTEFGAWITGNTADLVQRHICYFGMWEPNLTAWIARRLRPGDLFVDIGANIGYFTLLGSRLVGKAGRVVAIEPVPGTFELLRRNLESNKVSNVRAVNAAISDREEALQLFLPAGGDVGRTTGVKEWAAKRNFQQGPRVRAVPLESVLSREEIERVRIIKIDVEGYEAQVLPSLFSLLGRCRDDLEIMVEMTPSAFSNQCKTPADLLNQFAELGFHCYEIENDYTVGSYLRAGPAMPPRRVADLAFVDQRDLVLSRQDREAL
jgi:FkbM family methyltransferase